MEKTQKKSIKGIRIRTVNKVMICLSCVLYILLLSATIRVSRQYTDVHKAMDDYIGCESSSAMLMEGSAYLTEQVRLYVVTGDPQYVDAYFQEVQVTRRREVALEHFQDHHGGEQAYAFLLSAQESSNELMDQEIYAMRLVAEATAANLAQFPEEVRAVDLSAADRSLDEESMTARARDLVFGSGYEEAKTRLSAAVESSLDSIQDATDREMRGSAERLENSMVRQSILVSVLFIETIITFVMISVLIVKPLQIYVRCIKEDKMMEITGSYEFKYLALTYNDIYEINAANASMLRYQAEHDPLTGLMNRGAFDQMKRLLYTRGIPMALLIIDVDKFKEVNDGYGHEMGDRVLKKVAKILAESFRATDYPARIGGDEFAVILPELTRERRSVVETKIADMNDRLTHPTDGLPVVSLSVGGAFSDSGFTEELYAQADQALYIVKEHGRCGCRFYEEAG